MTPEPRISMAGVSALLLDAAGPLFEPATQHRVWAASALAQTQSWVREAAPGMNNMLVTYDPFATDVDTARAALRDLWFAAEPQDIAGADVTMPVVYGGADGADLAGLAAHTGFSIDEVVRRHAAATYRVAAVAAMPGYPYMFGLDPALAWNRRSSPRALLRRGAVIIGATQASIMPIDAPSGWHMLGRTEVRLFDLNASPPSLLRPGDAVRFKVADIVA
ncbi:MAG: carboxyltransferase domain-containing protein [Acetobacteraceae bacterium]|nr:carboxyltransferase domain-containing protein [Acetobacteraceae bacterium]